MVRAISNVDPQVGSLGPYSLQRGFESPFADEAPRAHHVGPDVDGQRSRHIGHPTAWTRAARFRGRSVRDVAADVQASFCTTLVAQWSALGVDTAFVAPGSRSTPMALALDGSPGWRVEVLLDERSAAFAALGYGLVTGRPAVALCTSGTAAAHFHAAVIEADLSAVPLLVVTADRPPELRDVGAPQTIDQIKMYGSSVRWFHDPGVAEWSTKARWPSLAAHCVDSSLSGRPGPVHLNLPFREPLVGDASVEETAHRAIESHRGEASVSSDAIAALAARVSGRRGVIVAGRGSGDSVDALAAALDWPVFAEPRAHCSGPRVVRHFDSLIRCESFASAHRPEVVLRVGEPPASKVTAQWFASLGVEQIHVSAHSQYFDPDGRIGVHVVAEPSAWAVSLARLVAPVDESWSAAWCRAEASASDAVTRACAGLPLSGPTAARTLVGGLPSGAHVVVSSSMPVRDLEWFGGRCDQLVVHSNRGANGIDGVIATAIGVAVATRGPVGVSIGDVALLHDSSSLAGLSGRGLDLRIVVTDNDGGGIFHYLPQASVVEGSRFEKLFGTPHGTDIAAFGRAHGLSTSVITSIPELEEALSRPGPSLMVVATDRRGDLDVHRQLHAAVAAATA
ncbi:MAG: 2-succinyl-5-enolpyruvyl-6-hydroxy-3-cyclohexene-1-carboxylic-acid synthase [Actinobacteria bacterium]|nr:2-succinyl-5-enolpyruvyl-6-hydroxy-3-cyclohexene-1-carboxylic-acid synthase [Actinomycetota bacterium]